MQRREREFGLEQGYRRIELGGLYVGLYWWCLGTAMVICTRRSGPRGICLNNLGFELGSRSLSRVDL